MQVSIYIVHGHSHRRGGKIFLHGLNFFFLLPIKPHILLLIFKVYFLTISCLVLKKSTTDFDCFFFQKTKIFLTGRIGLGFRNAIIIIITIIITSFYLFFIVVIFDYIIKKIWSPMRPVRSLPLSNRKKKKMIKIGLLYEA